MIRFDYLIWTSMPLIGGGLASDGITRSGPIKGALIGNSAGTSISFDPGDALLLEDGVSFLLLEDGASKLLLEPQ